MSENYPLSSYSPQLHGYAPADFQDAQETAPSLFILDPTFSGSSTPYSQLVQNTVNRQLQEIKEKTVSPASNGAAWRKRVKEFMGEKNEDLLSFLRKPLSNHPTLSKAESFNRKFGHINFTPTHQSLREIFLDGSGVSMVSQIEEELVAIGPSSSLKITEQVRWLYDAYRLAGEQVMKQESSLRVKLDLLDKLYQKTLGLLDLPMNETTAVFQQAAIDYLDSHFKEQDLEKEYTALVESFRRFTALKEMISTFRFTDTVDKEPLCCICLQEPVSFCVSPCGHTFCSSCVKRQATNCYMCRASIKDRVRIFFG